MAAEAWAQAMNTSMRLLLYPTADVGPAQGSAVLQQAETMVRRLEARVSRFLPDSELCEVNRSAGRWCSVSSAMAEVLGLAWRLHRETGGLFDPGILPRLEHAGYDSSFERLPANRVASEAERPIPPRIAAVEFDGPRRVRLLGGCRLDLGGIVKGWAADRADDWLAPYGAVVVDLGGDIAFRGSLADGSPWHVGLERPDNSGELLTVLQVACGGVATSSVKRRRWRGGESWMHHLIDPRTGQPASTDLVQVTALAGSTARADVWAKTALIAGAETCRPAAARHPELSWLLVFADGRALTTPGLKVAGDPGQQAA
ncbi:MAG: FAD:protein FMN transferase [Chloroflexota bacterium]